MCGFLNFSPIYHLNDPIDDICFSKHVWSCQNLYHSLMAVTNFQRHCLSDAKRQQVSVPIPTKNVPVFDFSFNACLLPV